MIPVYQSYCEKESSRKLNNQHLKHISLIVNVTLQVLLNLVNEGSQLNLKNSIKNLIPTSVNQLSLCQLKFDMCT